MASDLPIQIIYSGDMADGETPNDGTDATFASWLRQARADAGWTKTAAIKAVDEVGIKERTYTHWESGTIAKPDPRQVRKACIRLELSTREAAVALGIVTSEELNLPPTPPPIHPLLRKIQSLLRADQVPDKAKDRLVSHIGSAVDFWFEQLGIRDIREPSAEERAKGKPVAPKR